MSRFYDGQRIRRTSSGYTYFNRGRVYLEIGHEATILRYRPLHYELPVDTRSIVVVDCYGVADVFNHEWWEPVPLTKPVQLAMTF